jgi:hypothetical protein
LRQIKLADLCSAQMAKGDPTCAVSSF